MTLSLLREHPTPQQVTEMPADLKIMIKVVVDLRREIMTRGGNAHYAENRAMLIRNPEIGRKVEEVTRKLLEGIVP